MKLYSVYTNSHKEMKDQWFLKTLKDNYDLKIKYCDEQGSGSFQATSWSRAILFKSEIIVNAIRENWGDKFVYSDVDIQFFGQTEPLLLKAIKNYDIVCQQDGHGGQLCAGFFIARGNEVVLKLWESVREAVAKEGRDQIAFNRIIREMPEIQWNYLPDEFFGAGCGVPKKLPLYRRIGIKLKIMKNKSLVWKPNDRLSIPNNIVIHHANWTVGIENKIAQLKYVRNKVESRAC